MTDIPIDGEEVWSQDESIPSESEASIGEGESPPREADVLTHCEQDQKAVALAKWLTTFLLFLQMKFHLAASLLSLMFNFLKLFLKVLGRFSSFVLEISKAFPTSLYQAQKQCIIHKFQRYVTCKKCHRIYFMSDCVEGIGRYKKAKPCKHQPFGRKNCDTPLLKTVELCSGRRVFYPHLTYCYLGLRTSLHSILNRPDVVKGCEKWRERAMVDVLADVYDGKIWKDFQCICGREFLSKPFSYALLINVDWFQPYKHLSYSVGAIYIAILNLPRDVRYKVENVLLIGIMPGPHESKMNINSYLEPLVDELLQFWEGIELTVATEAVPKLVQCALVCASCDLPAGRKVCGFLGHAAAYGCSKCKKKFPGTIGCMDYSGFDRENWEKRSGDLHRRDALRLLQCTSKSALQREEVRIGCRYSVLLKLPYFDAPRMCAIDPMHNLFLGTAKHYLHSIWIRMGIITPAHFTIIQDRVNRMFVPPDIGRIPCKIESSFASFTADQLKNWVVYYSLIVLDRILTGDHLECWRHFVLACRILCSRAITRDQVCLADALLLHFCKRTERLYGKDKITPNMHMNCHLLECVTDFGPLASFWLFPFERYNGLLGKIPNNNRSIEAQLMQRFISDQSVLTLSRPHEFQEDFEHILQINPDERGTLGNSYSSSDNPVQFQCAYYSDMQISLPKNYQRCVFSSSAIEDIRQLYSKLYDVPIADIELNSSYQKYSHATVNGKTVGSYRNIRHTSQVVIAKWVFALFQRDTQALQTPCTDLEYRPANFIARHAATVSGTTVIHILFSASWFKPHPHMNWCGKPITIWENDVFELSGISSMIPIQLIQRLFILLISQLLLKHLLCMSVPTFISRTLPLVHLYVVCSSAVYAFMTC